MRNLGGCRGPWGVSMGEGVKSFCQGVTTVNKAEQHLTLKLAALIFNQLNHSLLKCKLYLNLQFTPPKSSPPISTSEPFLSLQHPEQANTHTHTHTHKRLSTAPMDQGCQVFATKPAQLLLKTSPIPFRGGFPGKNCIPGGKIHVFRRGSSSKIHIPGAKYHFIGVASTRGHEKQPAATVLK